jgi:hypothetical protein
MGDNLICCVIIVCVVLGVLYAVNKGCKLECSGKTKEHMTAGLSTTTGLSFYNQGRICEPGNATGSSDPYCTSPGYVLF